MLKETTQPSMARIEVQKTFCDQCSTVIKNKIQIIEEVKNIKLYPKQSLITFHFFKAEKLSEVLNVLSAIGCPEKGESFSHENQLLTSICKC